MNTAFKVKNKLGGIFGRHSTGDMRNEWIKAQAEGAMVSELMAYREWPVMDRIFMFFQNEAINGLAIKNISKEETQRLTNRMEQLRDIRNKLVAKIKAGEVARVKLERMKEKQNG